MVQNQAKTQVMYESGHGRPNVVQYSCQQDNCGRFCSTKWLDIRP